MAWSLFSQTAVTPLSWATSVLEAGGWPTTAANIQSLIAWALLEGGGGQYNPLNTTQTESGSSGLSGNSAGVQNYDSWGQGVTATVATINNGDYSTIVSDLVSGEGIGATSQLSTWSGGGYSSLSGTWSEAAQYTGGTAAALPGGTSATLTSADTTGGSVGSFIEGLLGEFSGGGAPGATILDIGSSIASISAAILNFTQKIDWLFHPSSWIRLAAFGGGVSLMGLGVWGMMHVGQSPGSVSVQPFGVGGSVSIPGPNLPVSMLAFGAGGVLLFVAFHNIPTSVGSFSEFVGYVIGEVTHPGTVAQAEAALQGAQSGTSSGSTGAVEV